MPDLDNKDSYFELERKVFYIFLVENSNSGKSLNEEIIKNF